MTRAASILRQLVAVVVIVLGGLNGMNLPTSIRTALVGIGGVILTADHVMSSLMDPATSINVNKLSVPAEGLGMSTPPASTLSTTPPA